MEKFLELQAKALEHWKSADRGLTFTYKLVKDNRVLLSIVNSTFLACTNAMGSLLHYELLYKRIPIFGDNFEAKFQVMKNRVAERYNLDPGYLRLMRDLREIIFAHNQSPIEFSRGERFVICSDNYELKEISAESLTVAIRKTKLFIDDVINITNKNLAERQNIIMKQDAMRQKP